MFAFIKHSGKQFKISDNISIITDTLNNEIGDTVEITGEDILLAVKDNGEIITNPKGSIKLEVAKKFKGDKVKIFKFRKKKCYKRTKGHRQQLALLRVKEINLA